VKKIFFIIILFICFAPVIAFCQDDTAVLKNIVTKLKTFSTTHPTEKAYLHFDKPYYAAGDTIYFKAYVTLGEKHELSNLSDVLHVDLINTQNKIDQSIKLQLINGVAWGDFALPDSLPKGNYRIRAYTNWMRNAYETAFFDHMIPIGSISNNKISESSTVRTMSVNVKPDIQFFPEGGKLVTGISSKVAFKAIGVSGLGVNVKGVVIDDANKEVTTFSSSHMGMGSFSLSPEQGKTYKSKLIYSNGLTDIVEIPKAEEKGIVLSVNNDSLPKASVRIEASKAFFNENKNRDFTLLIYSGGIATTVNCKLDTTVITFDILKRKLFTGITTITLFSPGSEPLSERLFFVQNYDQLNLNISTDKASYTKREKVNLKLNARTLGDSATMGNFSVSVIDESKVPINENNESTIFTNLLLTSDLKGRVEQPNYYFTNITDETRHNIDLVMLTHGYRRFEWKQVLNNANSAVDYQPENGLQIGGTAKTLLGKPIDHGTVSLISTTGGPLLSQQTDGQGNFCFSNLAFADTGRFVLNATKANGKNSTQLIYKPAAEPVVSNYGSADAEETKTNYAVYMENNQKQKEALKRPGQGKGKMLKEVNIKARKTPEYKSQSYIPTEAADQVIYGDQIPYGGALSVRLISLLHGVYWTADKSGSGLFGMTVFIDGVKGNIDQVSTDAVEMVEYIKPPNSYVYGSDGIPGVLIITTKPRTLLSKDIVSTGILPVTVRGFYKAREFYAPKYESNPTNRLSDLRSTIYWKPELITDKYGNASFEYYNAGGAGTYRVVIEGIDEKGNLGRQVYRYKVE
jgi:hypothetical protein